MGRYENMSGRLEDVSDGEPQAVPIRPKGYRGIILGRDALYLGTAGMMMGSFSGSKTVGLASAAIAAIGLGVSGYSVLRDA